MTPPPTSIDGTDITGATIDGQEVQEITIDGQTVFTAAPPEPDKVVDNFDAALYEDQNKTLSDRYTGDLNQFARVTSTTFDGNFSLQSDAGTGGGAEIRSISLPNLPQQGDIFEYYTFAGSTNQLFYFIFAGGHYEIHSGVRDGTLELIVDGTELDQDTTSLSTSQWYKHTVEWDNSGTITVTIRDLNGIQQGQVSGTDAQFTGGQVEYLYRKGETFLDAVFTT